MFFVCRLFVVCLSFVCRNYFTDVCNILNYKYIQRYFVCRLFALCLLFVCYSFVISYVNFNSRLVIIH